MKAVKMKVHSVGRKNKVSDIDAASRVLNDESRFATVETYKSIRTNIMFSMPRTDKGKVIAVTSSIPGEGKTTTSINLAITFAQTGAKVLLLDCDLRKARIHSYLDLSRKKGISNVLCGFSDLDAVIKKGVRDNMDVITAGEIPPNPAELLATEEFSRVLAKLQDKYDYIFIDTPPITVVTDATIVMTHCAGAIIVVRQDVTTFDVLDIAMERIKNTNTKILGAIVLGIEDKNKGYYKGHGGKYGYKYGSKYSYGYGYGYDYKYSDDDTKQ